VYASLTRVNSAGQPSENATMVAQEMNRWLRDIEGYHGFLMLSGDETTVGLTVWESKAVADLHREARMQFIERMTSIAGVQVEEIVEYDIAFADLGPLLSDPAT
jgi:uncharacterized membrane-anchored protein